MTTPEPLTADQLQKLSDAAAEDYSRNSTVLITALHNAVPQIIEALRAVEEVERLREALAFLIEGLPDEPNKLGFYDLGAVSDQVIKDARQALEGTKP